MGATEGKGQKEGEVHTGSDDDGALDGDVVECEEGPVAVVLCQLRRHPVLVHRRGARPPPEGGGGGLRGSTERRIERCALEGAEGTRRQPNDMRRGFG